MYPLPRRWEVCPPIPPALQAAAPGVHPVLAQLLYNRGVLTESAAPEDLERFLNPRWQDGLHDPFLMADMEPAVERILYARDRDEPIGVFGHFDADGITATALLTETLLYLGARAIPYIPSRADEYGVNAPGLADLAGQGARLVVSVDSGIRSFDAPANAARHGMDVIITDHHTVLREDGSDVRPEAAAVINPMRADCAYPCKDLAGVGVAFKLAQALLRTAAARRGESEGHFSKWLLDLVCLGTIADVVNLADENRTLVRLGLAILKEARRPGVKALLAAAGTKVNRIDVEAVGFQLAPRINAPARMSDPWLSLRLLRSPSLTDAQPLAAELDRLNRERQSIVNAAMAEIADRYGDTLGERKAIVVTGEWPGGILGLIAGKLCERWRRPAAVIECPSGDELHGSARSTPTFHISEALQECSDLLSRFGGHAQAAGFSLPRRCLDAFRERLCSLADARIRDEDMQEVLAVDAIVTPEQVTPELLEGLQALEPCGAGNPAPVFGMRGAPLAAAETFGSTGAHLRLRLAAPPACGGSGGGSGRTLTAKGWRMGALAASLPAGSRVSLAFQLRKDDYVGMSLDLIDVVPEG